MLENATIPLQLAGFRRRLASMFYESILVFSLLMLASFAYIPIFGDIQTPFRKAVFQFYLLVVMMFYFVTFWKRSGQTLPMKTWHIRVVNLDGSPLSTAQCVLRFCLAALGLLGLGLGIFWAFIDPERQFLHDRLCKTRLVIV